ncbi:MAG: ureidoglycolate lyase [Immundisolibacterales bacterium]|nr:ureidoglycolate lyase [Immundisolibacterales bacterium]
MTNESSPPLRHRLDIEPMTAESFAPFGRILESSSEPADERVMTRLAFECDGRTTVHAIWQPCAGRSFSRLERHFGVTQTFVQVSGSASVVCVAAPTDLADEEAIPRPRDVRAFLINPGRPFAFARGTWHSLDRFVLAPPGATFVILNVDPNPTQIVDFADGTSRRYADLDAEPSPAATVVDTGPPLVFEL